MPARVTVLRGDGIGPEVVEAALGVLGALVPIHVREARVGGDAIDHDGDPLPPETLAACRDADAVLLGAVGGPRWEGPLRAETGLLKLRQGLGLYANLRPARYLGLPTPLREGLARGADLLVVRDLAGGVYFGEPRGQEGEEAFNTWRQTAEQARRVARFAFEAARLRRRRVTSVDKANVLEASRLWRAVVTGVGREYPDVEVEHRYVDAASFELLQAPRRFDVILAENLFGDILSDELGAVVGSIGLLASASLGEGTPLFEPVHGSAPTLAGLGIANPTGAILSVAMMLRYALARPDLAVAVESAVESALREVRTPDIGGNATTREFTVAVLRRLSRAPEEDGVSAYGWGV
ncbi:MAG TPA: 3-isopropylmalate dehydrogenase [Vicinamibacteria bacterium]|nr:3-isopropylmalate dehydrogenase [Vicinamibacteria bacterium]